MATVPWVLWGSRHLVLGVHGPSQWLAPPSACGRAIKHYNQLRGTSEAEDLLAADNIEDPLEKEVLYCS